MADRDFSTGRTGEGSMLCANDLSLNSTNMTATGIAQPEGMEIGRGASNTPPDFVQPPPENAKQNMMTTPSTPPIDP